MFFTIPSWITSYCIFSIRNKCDLVRFCIYYFLIRKVLKKGIATQYSRRKQMELSVGLTCWFEEESIKRRNLDWKYSIFCFSLKRIHQREFFDSFIWYLSVCLFSLLLRMSDDFLERKGRRFMGSLFYFAYLSIFSFPCIP